jgi:ATP-dependent DNA helicase RecG
MPATRPNNRLDNKIEYLKGVGPKRSKLLNQELDIYTFNDLLHHYPYRYVDRTEFHKIKNIDPNQSYVQLKGELISLGQTGGYGRKRLIGKLKDDTGIIELVWFRGLKWLKKSLEKGEKYVVFGKTSLYQRKINLVHPDMEKSAKFDPKYGTTLQPYYHTTEKLKSKGLTTKALLKLQKTLLKQLSRSDISENLPDYLVDQQNFPDRYTALQHIHFPKNKRQLKKARQRLKFEELLTIQLRLLKTRHLRKNKKKGFSCEDLGDYFHSFYENNLEFELTGAQKQVLKEFRKDLRSGQQMNRLLQGDVGSGKTVVAVMTMLMALDNGYQASMMAPTEILARQHYETITEMLKGLSVDVALLTGSVTGKKREQILEACQQGELDILVGTHALIEDTVQFDKMGFVVIDEQHRFGVAQRAQLWKKSDRPPHVLVMSATPIPRTLAMTLYGDLDVSVIDELPPGRKPVKTFHRTDAARLKMFGFLKKMINKGHQVFIVYPLIEESEKLDYKNLQEGIGSIEREFPPPEYHTSIVHGRMKAEAKDQEMQRFVKGETQIMVATNVIEVGVDVPKANVMVIESAERFGLSQLHQLRGRVGRGGEQAYCILMTDDDLSENAQHRMSIMAKTNNGFRIAEADMKLRGPGDIEGTQQSGMIPLKIANLVKDHSLLKQARKVAFQIMDEDPDLTQPEHQNLRKYLNRVYKEKPSWGEIA